MKVEWIRRGGLISVVLTIVFPASRSDRLYGQSDAEVSLLVESAALNEDNLEHISKRLARIGKPAVPALLEAMNHRDSSVRTAAARAFSDIGPEDERILPALVAAMGRLPAPTDDMAFITVESAALISAIKSMGGKAMTPLVASLDHERPFTRATAALALATLAGMEDIDRAGSGRPDRRRSYPLSPEAIGRLIPCLDDDDGSVRFGAVSAMLTIGSDSEQAEDVIHALISRFEDPVENVASMAIEGITRFGPRSAAAVPPLVELFRARGPSMGDAVEALGSLGPIAAPAAPMLIEAATDEDRAVRAQAIRALGLIGHEVNGVERTLRAAMADIDYHVRTEASAALASVGQPELPFLIEALGSPNRLIRSSAAEALRRIGPGASSAAPALVSRLRDDDRMVLPVVTSALQSIGASAVPSLSEALGHEDWRIRLGAVEVLARIGPPASSAVDRISDLVERDSNPEVRRYAAFASATLRPDKAQNVGFLARVYSAEFLEADTRFHHMVLESAASLGASGTKEALAALMEILKRLDEDDRNGHRTIEWAFRHSGSVAVPFLVDGLGDEKLHRTLTNILQFIGLPSVPSLLVALFSDNAARRHGAGKCLGVILRSGAAYGHGELLIRPENAVPGEPLQIRPIEP